MVAEQQIDEFVKRLRGKRRERILRSVIPVRLGHHGRVSSGVFRHQSVLCAARRLLRSASGDVTGGKLVGQATSSLLRCA